MRLPVTMHFLMLANDPRQDRCAGAGMPKDKEFFQWKEFFYLSDFFQRDRRNILRRWVGAMPAAEAGHMLLRNGA